VRNVKIELHKQKYTHVEEINNMEAELRIEKAIRLEEVKKLTDGINI